MCIQNVSWLFRCACPVANVNSQPSSPYSLGVIGYPLSHSLSPRLHEAALRASGLAGEYRLYPIPPLPDGRESLKVLLDSFREGHLDGLNVTIPHKQVVIEFLDELSPLGRQIGAVNTIYRHSSSLIGDNTDAPGFMADLLKQSPQAATPQAALVLGGGGAARAVVYALLSSGWSVTIAARRPAMAQDIKNSMTFTHQPCEVIALDSLPEYVLSIEKLQPEGHEKAISLNSGSRSPLTLVVNTTPIGMAPDITPSPWPRELPFPRNVFVYDLVYNPTITALVRDARAAGLAAVNGLGMLIEQAALAFERWTGIRPAIDVMHQAVMTEVEFHGW
jgi:shikimate dehydrogenase